MLTRPNHLPQFQPKGVNYERFLARYNAPIKRGEAASQSLDNGHLRLCLLVIFPKGCGHQAVGHRSSTACREMADSPGLIFVEIIRIAVPVHETAIRQNVAEQLHGAGSNVDRAAHAEDKGKIEVKNTRLSRDDVKGDFRHGAGFHEQQEEGPVHGR